MTGERRFIVTIREDTDLNVYDLQEAVVDAANAKDPGTQVDHGSTDVELVEIQADNPGLLGRSISYRVLDGA